jgi:starch-binding outer membrane protein, SusD/RagB family
MNKIDIKYRIITLLYINVFVVCFISCKKFVTVDTPVTKTSTENAYQDDFSATAVLTGIYAQMSNEGISQGGNFFNEELSADNLILFDINGRSDLAGYYQNFLEPTYGSTGGTTNWSRTYNLLYTINTSIEMLSDNKYLTPIVSKRLLGEAFFLRAYCYFNLVNLYGQVPMILSGDYAKNAKLGRTSIDTINSQIITDLKMAAENLDDNYAAIDVSHTSPDEERLRPNLGAVNALLARAYLYQKNYAEAEAAATKVIDQNTLYSFIPLGSVFLKNSKETIWSLQSVNIGFNTQEGYIYMLPEEGPDYARPVYASASLVESFEPGDGRKNNWLSSITTSLGDTYLFPAKYKISYSDLPADLKEYTIVLRLAEQYLIRAEAKNEQGNTSGAVEDINLLRARSRNNPTGSVPNPLPDLLNSLTQPALRSIILNERRVELFSEFGHRWFDLKRSGQMDSIMTEAEEYKGGNWEPYKALYPIPFSDIRLNPAITQNPGYIN